MILEEVSGLSVDLKLSWTLQIVCLKLPQARQASMNSNEHNEGTFL
jgi:hypothetical protein